MKRVRKKTYIFTLMVMGLPYTSIAFSLFLPHLTFFFFFMAAGELQTTWTFYKIFAVIFFCGFFLINFLIF